MQIDNVSFAYGKQVVLSRITTCIQPGTYTSLIGPNGSGKTTLLGIASAYLKPLSGAVWLNGQRIQTMRINKRAQWIAVVQQRESVAMPFTCLEMVLMGMHPRMHRFISPPEAMLKEAELLMQETDTAQFADKPITEISGGEFQRVILTRALAQQPKYLLLDEAMSDLDVHARLTCLRLLKARIAQTGLTVLAVHHDINTAYQCSDRVIALKGGQLVAEGTPDAVMTRPNLYEIFGVQTEVYPGKGLLFESA